MKAFDAWLILLVQADPNKGLQFDAGQRGG